MKKDGMHSSEVETCDGHGRLAEISTPTASSLLLTTYSYDALNRVTGRATASPPSLLTASHTRDALGNILSVSNRWNAGLVSSFEYAYDALNRRTSRLDNGTALNTFAYNARSELTNACVATASLPSVYEYWHDAIGNTWLGTENGDTAYWRLFDARNQLTGYDAYSYQGDFFDFDLVYLGHQAPTHDPDGNMTYDGTFRYAWDAENRLIAVSNATGTAFVSSYTYDHLGRRITKSCFGTTYTFTYDGWNLIVDSSNTRYVWGLDLSGTMQGAGGVGGLAAVIQGNAPYIPCYDANGNVTEYVNGNNGSIAARYRYDAYGNTLAQSGPMAPNMTQRFSTKYYDGEYLGTDMYYYGFRIYAPRFHRWLSTDPIGERGGLNLYGFCGNDPINRWDYLGMSFLNGCDDCTETLIVSTIYRIFPANYKLNYDKTKKDGDALLKALGQSGGASSVADFLPSIASLNLNNILRSLAKLALTQGTDSSKEVQRGLQIIYSNQEKAHGETGGYLAAVIVRYRPCDTTKISLKRKPYKTWGKETTIGEIVGAPLNLDPLYQGFHNYDHGYIGFKLPDERESFDKAISDTVKEIINGLQ